MNERRPYKYSGALLTIAIIDTVFTGIFAVIVLFFRDILANIDAVNGMIIGNLLIGVAVIGVALVVLELVAAKKSKYSKGWTIYLIVASGLVLLGNLSRNNVLGLILPVLMLVFSILNLMDANKQNSYYANEASLESQLDDLNKLYDKGVITTEEYQRRRANIISKL